VNETISSLLLGLIALGAFNYLVEGLFRDPDPISANKPSTTPISDVPLLGNMFGYDVHWGLGLGVLFCVLSYVLMYRTTFGFAARMVGGNVRAAQAAGLPVGLLLLTTCLLAGAAAGLAGAVEIAAVQRQANSSLFARPGLTIGLMGVLVSFVARHNPLGVIVAATLVGGVIESSSMFQRRLKVPDASAQVLMGILIVMIILSETLYGRFRLFLPRDVQKAMVSK
jgi:simple sugar transport system permease protein